MRKILLVRFSSIGDIVLTTPVIRALHQQLGAEVHILTKQSFGKILQVNPYTSRIWTIEKQVSEVLPGLQQEGFSAVIDLHRNLRTLRLRFGLRGVPFYRFNKLNWEKWLLTRWKIDRLPPVHIVDRYLAAAAALGIQHDGQGLDYFIPADQEIDLANLLPNGATNYFAFVIGAAHATKRLPEDHIIRLCQQLSSPIILLGGPGEKLTGESIAAAAGEQVINTCGLLSLHQSASVVRQAACVITHDTGLMHIAAAFRRPIVSIWGNTVPEFGMYPYYPEGMDRNFTQQVEGLACRPCSKIGYQQCPKGHFRCMHDQSIDEMAKAAQRAVQMLRGS